MSIETAEKYSFDFAELAQLEAPLKTLGATFKSMSLRPNMDEEQQFNRFIYSMAQRGGIGAALNRLLPQSPYAGTFIEFSPGVTVALVRQTIRELEITRRVVLGRSDGILSDTTCSIPCPGGKELVFSQTLGFVRPGPWLQTLQDAANKLPEHRHESPAAFQRWLASTRAPAAS